MSLPPNAILLGSVWSPDARGPSVVTVRDGRVIDITSSVAPLVADICAMADPAGYVRDASGLDIGVVADFLR